MITFKRGVDHEHKAFSNHEDLEKFSEAMRNSLHPSADDQKVFVWDGFSKDISFDLFDNATWQQSFVRLFSDQEKWTWKFKTEANSIDQSGNQDLIEILASPTNCIVASLEIRTFGSEDKLLGSAQWFEEIRASLNSDYNECRVLIDNIIQNLHDLEKVGVRLYLEKISLLVSTNPENTITLTPHLHRDSFYGPLESAIVSFYSEKLTPNSSTLFFPDFDFSANSHLKPITADKLNDEFSNTTGFSVTSGSLAMYSGNLSIDRSHSNDRGALHVSPEGFFPTRRLAFMFRSNIIS